MEEEEEEEKREEEEEEEELAIRFKKLAIRFNSSSVVMLYQLLV